VKEGFVVATKALWDVKEGDKDLGMSFRDLLKAVNLIGITWSPDVVEQGLRVAQ